MTSPRPRRKSQLPQRTRRVRHLLSLDSTALMRRLLDSQLDMVALFSRLRDRKVLLRPLHSCFATVTFSELALLEPSEQREVSAFYEQVEKTRSYLEYTEDMPLQVQQRLDRFVRELSVRHEALIQVLGPPEADGAEVVNAPKSARGLPKG